MLGLLTVLAALVLRELQDPEFAKSLADRPLLSGSIFTLLLSLMAYGGWNALRAHWDAERWRQLTSLAIVSMAHDITIVIDTCIWLVTGAKPFSSFTPRCSLSSPSGRSTAPSRTAAPASAPKAPTPGMVAPKWEKELHKALISQPDPKALARIGAEHEPARPVAALFEATIDSVPSGNTQRAIALLGWLFGSGYDPAKDEFIRKYRPAAGFGLSIADGIDVMLAPDRDFSGSCSPSCTRKPVISTLPSTWSNSWSPAPSPRCPWRSGTSSSNDGPTSWTSPTG